jgi:hypothetical protein
MDMNHKELFEKYGLLLNENDHLIEENNRLKEMLGITEPEPLKDSIIKSTAQNAFPDEQSTGSASFPALNNSSDSILKKEIEYL